MDSFGGFSIEGEWDLCSSILSLEEFDFTPNFPQATAGIADAWFCSLDSFTANLNSCVFGANSRDENDNAIDQFPCIAAAADHDHASMFGGAIEEKKMESIFSACSDILLQEITGFCGEDRFLNMEVETHQGDNASNPVNSLHHKRKSIVVADDEDVDQNNNHNKKIQTSNNVQRTRKATQSNAKSNQKLSTRRRKCEEEQENGGSEVKSCSSDNSSDQDDNASQDTNGGSDTVLEGDASPAKGKTRATRGSATDPQSLYARKRRERINERLRILQKLVPNGTKVDISTMLEEAVHYVKFLQLQIKLLSSDELWMYAPIAYNGMDIGLQQKLSSFL